jgi:type II secretory pathway pseudopilin PulG
MKLIKHLRTSNGFSLLELIIYIGILSGVMLMIVNLFVIISASSANEEARTEVQQNLQFAIQQMSDNIRPQNDIVNISANGDILDLSSGSDPNKVTLRFDASNNALKKIQGIAGASSCDSSDGKCKADCAVIDPDCSPENIVSSKVSVGPSSPIDPIFNQIDNTIQIILEISYNDKGRKDYIFSQKNQTTVSLR